MFCFRRTSFIKALIVCASTVFLSSFMYTATVTMHNRDVAASRDPQQSGILANVGRYLGIVGDEVSDYSSYLNIVNFETFVYLNSSLCRSADFDGVQIPMCPFEYKVDHDISEPYLRGSYFEKGPVTVIVNELRKNEKLEFVDLGANIGSYTVAVARLLGRHVVAVEATPETVKHLSTALRLNNATDHVTIAHNAIGNTHDEVTFARTPGRSGLNHVVSNGSNERFCSHGECIRIRCVMLDDLIPLVTSDTVVIKADIEESEPNVFRNESAGRFFKKFKIPFIMMEFEEYLRTEARRNSTAEWVDGFFYSRNYVPYNAHNNQQLERNFLRWPYLIYWKKHD